MGEVFIIFFPQNKGFQILSTFEHFLNRGSKSTGVGRMTQPQVSPAQEKQKSRRFAAESPAGEGQGSTRKPSGYPALWLPCINVMNYSHTSFFCHKCNAIFLKRNERKATNKKVVWFSLWKALGLAMPTWKQTREKDAYSSREIMGTWDLHALSDRCEVFVTNASFPTLPWPSNSSAAATQVSVWNGSNSWWNSEQRVALPSSTQLPRPWEVQPFRTLQKQCIHV